MSVGVFICGTTGHTAKIAADGRVWVSKCSCGWLSDITPERARAEARSRRHVAIIDAGRLTREAVERVAHDPIKQARFESLGRAEREHVARCTDCGGHTWDGRCSTCTRLNQREAQRLGQLEESA